MHPFLIARCNLPSKIMALASKPEPPIRCAFCFFGDPWKGRGVLLGKETFLSDHDDVHPVIRLETDSLRCAWVEYEPSEIPWPSSLDGNVGEAMVIDDNLRRATTHDVPTAYVERSVYEPGKQRVNAPSAKGRRRNKAGKGGKQRRRF